MVGIGGSRHAPVHHRAEFFVLERPKFDLERRTRAVVELLTAVFCQAVEQLSIVS